MTQESEQSSLKSVSTFSDKHFDDFELHPLVRKGLQHAKFQQCTPIQAQTLPLALAGKDVAGQGQTGTGKTAAFLIAAFNLLLTRPTRNPDDTQSPRVLILAPTRELAIQIHKDAVLLGQGTGLRLGLAYGGIDYEKQRRQLADGIDILIGTPGRIIDYFKQKVFHLNNIQVMVLDEADRMFDLGFIKDIRFLLRRMPKPEHRLSMLLSATLSLRVMELAYEHMNEAKRVEVQTDKVTADRVSQVIYFPANNEKMPLLLGLLNHMDPKRTMVFCNTKASVERVSDTLCLNGFNADVLSGDVRQSKRQTLLKRFHDGQLDILVATDVAARGLHIPDVTHVFNYDLPHEAEDYVHRIGRTARLGTQGDAVSFACEDSAFTLPEIEDYIGFKIPVEPVEERLQNDFKHAPRRKRPPRGRSGGGRNQQQRKGRPPRRR